MKRICGIDLIRVIATFFIPAIHFFAYSGYDKTIMSGSTMFISTFIRWLFYIGVPLFMILTGYLKNNKKFNTEHYKGLTKIIVSYIFISIICLIFKKLYYNSNITITSGIISILNFSACNYAWYIEMYIGLFLLIPFLNILYKNIDSRINKKNLILILILICSTPSLLNYFVYNNSFVQISSDYWVVLYPLIYYYIGCYINEYKVNVKKWKLIIIILLTLLIETIMTYLYNFNNYFSWQFLDGYNSILSIIISTSIFLLLYNIDIKNNCIKRILSHLSILSLDIYLFSYISDSIVYKFLSNKLCYLIDYIKYMFLIIIFSYILAYIMALFKKFIFDIFQKKIE